MPYSGDATLHEPCVVHHSKNEPPMAEMGNLDWRGGCPASLHVRFAPETDHSVIIVRSVAKCHNRPHAVQQAKRTCFIRSPWAHRLVLRRYQHRNGRIREAKPAETGRNKKEPTVQPFVL